MEHITPDMLRRAVEAQGDTFDSHCIEHWLYQHEQRALVRELYRNRDATYPFTETCKQLGLALSRMADVIEKDGESSSPPFRLQDRPCAHWRKVKRGP